MKNTFLATATYAVLFAAGFLTTSTTGAKAAYSCYEADKDTSLTCNGNPVPQCRCTLCWGFGGKSSCTEVRDQIDECGMTHSRCDTSGECGCYED